MYSKHMIINTSEIVTKTRKYVWLQQHMQKKFKLLNKYKIKSLVAFARRNNK